MFLRTRRDVFVILDVIILHFVTESAPSHS